MSEPRARRVPRNRCAVHRPENPNVGLERMKVNPQVKGALKALAMIGILLVCVWTWVGVRVGVWGPLGYLNLIECSVGIQPLGFWLWRGDIKPGTSMQDLLQHVRSVRGPAALTDQVLSC